MNKLMTKIVGVALGLTMAIGVSVAVGSNTNKAMTASALESSYTFTSKSWADSTNSWTSNKDGGQLTSGRGVQVTTTYSGASATSKSTFQGISTIMFTYSTNASSGAGSISVKIGDNTAISKDVTKTGGTTDRTLFLRCATPQSGTVTFTVTCTDNSIYVKSVEIAYFPDFSTATYTVTGKSSASQTGGPVGSSVTYSQTYDTQNQATSGHSFTMTVSGFAWNKIIGANVKVHSNSRGGGGSLSLTTGATSIASISDSKFNTDNWNATWSTEYVWKTLEVTPTIINSGATIVLSIAATANSLFFESLELIYVQVTTYQISFNMQGHGTAPSNQTIIEGGKVTKPTDPTATGYTFGGWYKEEACTNAWNFDTDTVTSNKTLYAKWTLNSYTVGGTITNGSLSSTANVSHGSALDITINPSDGYGYPESLTSVTMGGSAYAGYTYTAETGRFQIASVTGNVVINATCPANSTTYTISGTITNGTLIGDTGEQLENRDYVLEISPNKYYKYPSSISVSGAGDENEGWEYDSSDGTIIVYGLSNNVSITATCPSASITGIAVSGAKDTFTLGDPFVSTGLVVDATYNDALNTTEPLNSGYTINSSEYDPYTEGEYEIVVSYGNISNSYYVEVSAKEIHQIPAWTRITSVADLTSGTYIMGYEDTVGNTTIVPLRSDSSAATTTANGAFYTGTANPAALNDGNTISISSSLVSAKYEVTVTKISNGVINIQLADGNYVGASSGGTSSNTGRLYSEGNSNETNLTVQYSNGKFSISAGVAGDYKYFKYNSSSPRYAFYNSSSYDTSFYKKSMVDGDVAKLIKVSGNTKPADNEKVEGYVCEVTDFTLTALFDTGDTETVTPTSIVSGATLSYGTNTVTLSYTDPNDSQNTLQCSVTVIADEQKAELVGVGLNDSEFEHIVLEGSSCDLTGLTPYLLYDDETTGALDINDCEVALYSKSGDAYTKERVIETTTYTWDLDDFDLYIGITYENYYSAYASSPIKVVESIDSVRAKQEVWSYTAATSLSDISVGKTIVIADKDKANELSGISNSLGQCSTISTNPSGTFKLEVVEGSVSGSFAFKNGNSYLAYTRDEGTTNNNELLTVDTVNDTSSWTIEFDQENNEFKLINVHNTERYLQYNYNNGNPRFAAYRNGTQKNLTIYIATSSYNPYGSNIANTDVKAQYAVIEYAKSFIQTLEDVCIEFGKTNKTTLEGKWDDLADQYDNWFNNGDMDLTATEIEHAKSLFAYADSNENGDTLQQMLAKYDYIVSRYHFTDFLHIDTGTDRREVPIASSTPMILNFNSSNLTALAIVTLTMTLLTASGYFFLKKRKEQ